MALIDLKQIKDGVQLKNTAEQTAKGLESAKTAIDTLEGLVDGIEVSLGNINQEIEAVDAKVDAETTRAQEAERELRTSVDANAQAIAAEKQRAEGVEQGLAQKISDTEGVVAGHTTKISALEEVDVELGDRITALESHEHTADEIVETEDRKFISQSKIDQYDENTIFSADMLTVNSLGGIPAGADLNGLGVQQLLTKLLFPYVAPTLSVAGTPNGGTYEKGNAQTISNVRAVVGKKSERITKVEVLDGSSVLESKSGSEVVNGGTFDFAVNVPVNSVNKQLTVKVTDASGKSVSGNTGSFNFVYPYYMGVCDEGATINADLVKGLTKKIEGKGNKSHAFNCNFQRMVFAYPKSHGALKQILDPNNFDVTGTFGRQEVSITGLDGTAQTYYVYVNSASTVSNFTVRFNY